MSSAQTDYYATLEVTRDCDGATLKSAYRKLAMKFHPDRNPGDASAEAKFKAISEAYDCLKDPQKRAAYDRYGHEAFTQGMNGGGFGGGPFGGGRGQDGFADIGDIFETIFGSAFGGGGAQRQQTRRGADLRYDMQVTLEEAFTGKSTEIEIEVSQSCDTCDGSGATPGTSERQCNLCHGMGSVRAKQGLFVIERPCPTCNGRGTRLFSDPGHDARAISKALSQAPERPFPLAGFFAAGEIGPIGASSFLHGHTASLALFRPKRRVHDQD